MDKQPLPSSTKRKTWSAYYRATADRPARETLTTALDCFEAERQNLAQRFAIDLGCGAGIDTFELLRRGWRVLAIDNQPKAIDLVRTNAPPTRRDNLRLQLASFEQVELPPTDLVNASFTLPFCAPTHFDDLWAKIVAAIRPGGRFAGHFFGPQDGWAGNPRMTFHTAGQISQFFQNFETDFFLETNEPGQTACGKKKQWHVFAVVAKKLSTI